MPKLPRGKGDPFIRNLQRNLAKLKFVVFSLFTKKKHCQTQNPMVFSAFFTYFSIKVLSHAYISET